MQEIMNVLIQAGTLTFDMAWKSWWALVLGLTIAGAVEAFVSEEQMTRVLGGRGLKSLSLGTLFGAASSSCSFGAVATTKSLFKKGASAAASFAAFQFASTNLVIELGLVMWVLLGWEFVLANFVSGLILIVLLATVMELFVPQEWFDYSRDRLRSREGVRDPQCGMEVDPAAEDTVELETEHGTEYFCSEHCKSAYEASDRESNLTDKLMTREGWANAFRNAIGEWNMLWFDIAIGFVMAGLIGAAVPRSWWTTLFEIGTAGTVLWVISACTIGVIVGVITFVCSVGNVPFALILWKNGIAFGGVMSFIFADLIVPNIVDAYRRYYGWRLALTLFAAIFVTAVASGVIIHYIWGWLGLVPPPQTVGGTAPEGYTVYLNSIFTVLFLIQLWVANRPANTGTDENGGHEDHQ
ncbi:MAG: permease [bacterium]